MHGRKIQAAPRERLDLGRSVRGDLSGLRASLLPPPAARHVVQHPAVSAGTCRLLQQNSKEHYVPHDYIALLGDSYAAGVGDWLFVDGGLADKPYHSANVIHDLTHRDVASFGRVNIGSAQMMVDRVARILDDDYCYLFPPIERPRRFVVYFYEGNDISDNYELMLDDIKPHDRPLAPQIDAFLRNRYARTSAWVATDTSATCCGGWAATR